MTHQFQSTATHETVQLLAEHGFEAMAQAIQVLMNEAKKTGEPTTCRPITSHGS